MESQVIFTDNTAKELPKLCKGYSKIIIISGDDTARHWLGSIQKEVKQDSASIVFDSGEASKTLSTIENLCRQLRSLGADRRSLVVSLGGGVTNDIVGFVAATYMRGVEWITIPTTVVAQADASIGGKTGVNLSGYKNMIGNFHMPKAVLINHKYLKTLPKEYLVEGLGEIIKMGFIYDKRILDYLDKLKPGKIEGTALQKAIELAAQAKIKIVEKDKFEGGQRKLVNFGHTIGHAVETTSLWSDRPLKHGEAISVGIIAEAYLSELERVCPAGLSVQVKAYCQKFGLPQSVDQKSEQILEKITADKKNIGNTIYWVLPTEVGKGIFDHKADPKNIKSAIEQIVK
jgi:3-dehydroquinate synthase